MVSALSGSFFMRFGKWNMIMVCNVIMILGSLVTCYDNIWVIFAGKITVGLAVGGYCVYCPNYYFEIAPPEMRGKIGGVSNLIVGFGILTPALFGLGIPDKEFIEKDDQSFAIQQYWRVIWAWPILVAVVQSVLLLTVFNFNTTVELKRAGKIEGPGGLLDVLGKIYSTEEEVKTRNEAIAAGTQSKETKLAAVTQQPTGRKF